MIILAQSHSYTATLPQCSHARKPEVTQLSLLHPSSVAAALATQLQPSTDAHHWHSAGASRLLDGITNECPPYANFFLYPLFYSEKKFEYHYLLSTNSSIKEGIGVVDNR